MFGLRGKFFCYHGIVCGLLHYDFVNIEILKLEITLEADIGVFLVKLGNSGRIILSFDIAKLGTCHLVFGKFCFDCHHIVGKTLGVCLAISGKSCKCGKIRAVCLTHAFGTLGIVGVVIAVAKTEAALSPVHRIDIRVFKVGHYPGAEEHVESGQGGHHLDNLFAWSVCYKLKVGLKRLDALGVKAHAVHTHREQIAYFLSIRTGLGFSVFKTHYKFANLRTIVFGQLVESSETRILCLERIGFHPASAGIVIEIGSRLDCCIKIGRVDSLGRGFLAASPCEGSCSKQRADKDVVFI